MGHIVVIRLLSRLIGLLVSGKGLVTEFSLALNIVRGGEGSPLQLPVNVGRMFTSKSKTNANSAVLVMRHNTTK